MKAQNIEELIGKVFGRLTVISYSGFKGNTKWPSRFFLCKCICGVYKDIRMTDFKTGRIKSCGCLQKEISRQTGIKSKLPNGISPRNTLFAEYRKAAENRGLSFSLDKETFNDLINKNCYYCGDKPNSICRTRHHPDTDFVIYNGIDRKDNNIGYEKENCVTCCSSCNYSKSDLEYKDFLIKVKKIYLNHYDEISIL